MSNELFPDYRIGPEAMKYFERGYRYQMKGELEGAVKAYQRSLEIQPTAEGYTFLGWAYSCMGKLEEAIKECLNAIATDPDFGNPYNDIGSYYSQMGKFDEAIRWLEKAKHVTRYASPEFPYTNLGKIYEQRGLWPLAIKEYQAALQVNSGYYPAREALKRLEPNLN